MEYDLTYGHDSDLINDYVEYDDYEDLNYMSEEQALIYLEHRLDNYSPKQQISYLAENCMTTVFFQAIEQVKILVLCCSILRLITVLYYYFAKPNRLFSYAFCWICTFFGGAVLHAMYSDIFKVLISAFLYFVMCSFLCNWIFFKLGIKGGFMISFATVTAILLTEFYFLSPSAYNRMRGILLLLAMKIMSVSIDLDNKDLTKPPNLFEYCAYCFHPGTLIFGPWISLQEFKDSFLESRPFNLNWIACVAKMFFLSSICMLMSTCVFPYLFADPLDPHMPIVLPFIGNNWMISYMNATSFHFSHYYVCFLGTFTGLLSGVGATKIQNKKIKTDDKYGQTSGEKKLTTQYTWSNFVVTRPLDIEVPTSMLSVVVSWNVPMSRWLKRYVFNYTRVLGDFAAILFTYATSALLHGLSFHLASILLSLALYTYTEQTLRYKLSKIFKCNSIRARTGARSKEQSTPLWAKLFNFTWIAINIMHLAYLGAMFTSDGDSESSGYTAAHTLSKWANLNYFSHITAFACLLCTFFL